jgi:hypothetical protein
MDASAEEVGGKGLGAGDKGLTSGRGGCCRGGECPIICCAFRDNTPLI